MANLSDVQAIIGDGGHRGVVSAVRSDGSVHSSLVSAGVLEHPVTGERAVAFTTAGDTLKLRLLRARPTATLVFQAGYHWASVGGVADLIGYQDPFSGMDEPHLRAFLRTVFSAAGGTHEDWEAYDEAMREQQRSAVVIRSDRVFAM